MKQLITISIFLCTLYLIPYTTQAQSPYVQFTYDANGNRTGREIVFPGARKGDSQTIDTTAIKDQLGDAQLNLYPNPVIGELQIKISPASDTVTANGTIDVYDVKGLLVSNGLITNNQGSVDLSHQSTGIYIVRITALDSKKEWKVVKE